MYVKQRQVDCRAAETEKIHNILKSPRDRVEQLHHGGIFL